MNGKTSIKKKSSLWIVIPVAVAAVVFGLILVVGVIRYLKPAPPPEGYTSEHHSYNEILEYAEAIDPEAAVSGDYVDLEYNEDSTLRVWTATINGIECHVVSFPQLYLERPNSMYLMTGYVIGSDYSNKVMDMILKEYPELGSTDEENYTNHMKYREYIGSQVISFVEMNCADEDAFDSLWDSYVAASAEYASYSPDKQYVLAIKVSQATTYYFTDTTDDTYSEVKQQVFSYFEEKT